VPLLQSVQHEYEAKRQKKRDTQEYKISCMYMVWRREQLGQKEELKYGVKYVRNWMEVGNTVQGTVTYRTVEQAMQ
jgi:hypothetical protein